VRCFYWYNYCSLRTTKVVYNKKFSYRWQTARLLCTPLLRYPWHKTLRSTAFYAVLSRAALWWMTAIYWSNFPTFVRPFSIWRPRWGGSHRAVEFIVGKTKLEWLGYNLVKAAWWSTQSFGHNTSTWQTHRQPRRHSKCHANALVSGRKTATRNKKIDCEHCPLNDLYM